MQTTFIGKVMQKGKRLIRDALKEKCGGKQEINAAL